MIISYKPLWKLLIDRDIKKKDLCQMAGISPATITKMGKGGQVCTSVLEKICTSLNCSISDILETVSETTPVEEILAESEICLTDANIPGTKQPSNNPFDGIDINSLVDIRDVKIDTSLPIPERIKSYIEQVQNPYYFRVGDVVVHVSYAENGPSLQELLEGYLQTFGSSEFGQCQML